MVNNAIPTEDKSSLITPLVVVFVLLSIVGLGWWWLNRAPAKKELPPISEEAKEYVRYGNLALSDVEMKATANYTGAAIIEITGTIINRGTRRLNRVELNCIFYDTIGQAVLRERLPIVRSPLNAGDRTAFRLPFEGLPDSWNKQMPQLVIADIVFAK